MGSGFSEALNACSPNSFGIYFADEAIEEINLKHHILQDVLIRILRMSKKHEKIYILINKNQYNTLLNTVMGVRVKLAEQNISVPIFH